MEKQFQVLRAIGDLRTKESSKGVGDEEITKKINMDLEEVQAYLDVLEDENYVQLSKTFGPKYSAWLTSRGFLKLKEYPSSK